jgi:hypothetical protein
MTDRSARTPLWFFQSEIMLRYHGREKGHMNVDAVEYLVE